MAHRNFAGAFSFSRSVERQFEKYFFYTPRRGLIKKKLDVSKRNWIFNLRLWRLPIATDKFKATNCSIFLSVLAKFSLSYLLRNTGFDKEYWS